MSIIWSKRWKHHHCLLSVYYPGQKQSGSNIIFYWFYNWRKKNWHAIQVLQNDTPERSLLRIFCPKQPTEWLTYQFPQLELAHVAGNCSTSSYVRNGFLQGFSILIFLFYTKIIASKKIIQTNNCTEDRNWNHSDSHAFWIFTNFEIPHQNLLKDFSW